ncbi:MFS transporter [Arthrobacter pascens]|uniref:MFS transporter n=1 Tax=Arthrobacter pascens TaxID=1677 RepID=UPI00196AA7F6|nr:MFS transporter [Arthrobacter pascens]MBN3499690.1 DHA2 family efflux MFS transporter permease subunit [Arthrobacter pascens]
MSETEVQPTGRRSLGVLPRWIILFSITTGTFMANVDATAVVVALPTMAREFGVGIDALQWVLSAYLLAITAVLPFFGQLSDAVGRKRILSLGLLIFVVASLCVAMAPALGVMILFRVFQGIGAGMFMATITPMALAIFPVDQRGRILGIIGSMVAAGTLLGPALGGVLTGAFGWRAIFLINVPVGLVGAIGTLVLLPKDSSKVRGALQLDVLGLTLFIAFSSTLLLGLGFAPSLGWSSEMVVALLAAAVIACVLFILRELTTTGPLINLRFFRRRVYGWGMLAAFLSYILMLFPAFLFPLYLHEVLGWSIGLTGLVMTCQAFAMLLVSPVSGWWSDRVGSRRPALVALVVMVLTFLAASFLEADSSPWLVAVLLALLGVGVGLFSSPNSSAVMGDLGQDQAGVANGTIATLRNLGRSIGVALTVLLYQLFAGSPATAEIPADRFLAGFQGVLLIGASLAAIAFLAVVFMYRTGSPTPKPNLRPFLD